MSYGTIAETMDINSGNFKNKNGYVNNKDFLVFPEEEDATDLADRSISQHFKHIGEK